MVILSLKRYFVQKVFLCQLRSVKLLSLCCLSNGFFVCLFFRQKIAPLALNVMVNSRGRYSSRKCSLHGICEWDTVANLLSSGGVPTGNLVSELCWCRYYLSYHRLCQCHLKCSIAFADNVLQNCRNLVAQVPAVDNCTCITWTIATGNGCLWSWQVCVPVQLLVFYVSEWPQITGFLPGRK